MEFSTLKDPKRGAVPAVPSSRISSGASGLVPVAVPIPVRRLLACRSSRKGCWTGWAGARSPRPARRAVPADDLARDRRVRDERGGAQLVDLGRGVGTTLRPAGLAAGLAGRSTRSPAGTGFPTNAPSRGIQQDRPGCPRRRRIRVPVHADPARARRADPHGLSEREQRRAHRAADDPPPPPRRNAVAVDGKCLRAARRPDGSQVLSCRPCAHADAVTLASREIAPKSNEISQFAPPARPDRRRRPHRRGRHRRCATRTARSRHLPRRAAPRPLPDHCQGQPAHPRCPATTPALEAGTSPAPTDHTPTRPPRNPRSPGRHRPAVPPRPPSRADPPQNADAWARRNGPARSSTPSPTCPPTRPAQPRSPPGPADTGP
jgi:hypothetical protein